MKRRLDDALREAETSRRKMEDAYAEVANKDAELESKEHDDPSDVAKLKAAKEEIASLEQHVERLEVSVAEVNREAAKELGAARKEATELKEKLLKLPRQNGS